MSKQGGASKQMSGASERVNGRASGPVLTSGFLIILAHNGVVEREMGDEEEGRRNEREDLGRVREHFYGNSALFFPRVSLFSSFNGSTGQNCKCCAGKIEGKSRCCQC